MLDLLKSEADFRFDAAAVSLAYPISILKRGPEPKDAVSSLRAFR
jgi:hypothetical protein